PSDGKAVADISAEHGVHCGRKAQHIARREENFDKFLCVPSVDKAEINIHRSVYRALVPREQPFCPARTIKHFVSRISSQLATEHCEENAAAINWIDETSGIARKQPAVSMQLD